MMEKMFRFFVSISKNYREFMKKILMFLSRSFENLKTITMIAVIGWTQVFLLILSSGCMMHGMKKGGNMMDDMMGKSTEKVQSINSGQVIDRMVEEMVTDLDDHKVKIKSLAVWQIRSKTAGLDVETIRQKIISNIVSLNTFEVIARDRFKEVLEEQSLALSGVIDKNSAVAIGTLIGVDGFIDGYCSLEDNRLILSLNLIETKRGVILWAKIIEEALSN